MLITIDINKATAQRILKHCKKEKIELKDFIQKCVREYDKPKPIQYTEQPTIMPYFLDESKVEFLKKWQTKNNIVEPEAIPTNYEKVEVMKTNNKI